MGELAAEAEGMGLHGEVSGTVAHGVPRRGEGRPCGALASAEDRLRIGSAPVRGKKKGILCCTP